MYCGVVHCLRVIRSNMGFVEVYRVAVGILRIRVRTKSYIILKNLSFFLSSSSSFFFFFFFFLSNIVRISSREICHFISHTCAKPARVRHFANFSR